LKRISTYFLPVLLLLSIAGCSSDKSFLMTSTKIKNLPPLKFAKSTDPIPNKTFPYELNVEVSFSGELDIYMLINKEISKEDFKELVSKFEMSPIDNNYSYSKDTYTYNRKNNYETITAEQKGIFTYSVNQNTNSSNKKKVKLLTDTDAEKFARDYLTNANLLPDDFYVSSISDGLISTLADGTKEIQNRKVVFNKKIRDKLVIGECKIVVYVGEEGLVEGVYSHYKDLRSCGKKQIKNIQAALEDLNANRGLESFTKGVQPVKCVVEKVELCYYEGSEIDNQPYLYPVYKMTGYTLDEKGNKYAYTGLVQAVE